MGGSSSWSPSRKDLGQLESLAKEALREAVSGRRNVFISFAYEDLGDVNLLRGQARNASSPIEFNDWSLREPFDSTRASYIKQGIRERIRQASATLVYVSDATARSQWVDWEVRESLALGKRVIAVYRGLAPPSRLPPAVEEAGIKPIPWSWDGIAKALE